MKVSGLEAGANLQVIDAQGREVYRATNLQSAEVQLSTAGWATGIYYLKATQGQTGSI